MLCSKLKDVGTCLIDPALHSGAGGDNEKQDEVYLHSTIYIFQNNRIEKSTFEREKKHIARINRARGEPKLACGERSIKDFLFYP